ncbi:DNA-directed RNA polymerase I subunit RPA1-like isoform X2 [Paramacrobiotus metropolitanus]|nr:DNA-directed RNA polymerase I subunit RPA1-like isoform X2 [Paramacrobiotus metropolitanus]
MVSPPKFRPIRVVDGFRYAHAESKNLERIIQCCNNIRILRSFVKQGASPKIALPEIQQIPGNTMEAKLLEACDRLQVYVSSIADGDADKMNPEFSNGVKQILEKKEGLFRMHMMGKRVNYSARSVISPDPYLKLNEIGIPEYIALRWTYPAVVTTNNIDQLRKAVINGPAVHPGADKVINDDGTVTILKADNPKQRMAIAKGLLAGLKAGVTKKVHRHLINGDIMLLNRQPTLHKPSIMAHKARILKGEKTLRLHYANCKSYNADFDGDEMNAHLPQDEVARSEAHSILNASYQYLVPKDGTPLSGLIQDHIVAGVHFTIRGRFFNKADYEQLVFSALGDLHTSVRFLPPAIWKPAPLWSGKQVISTIVINLVPEGMQPLSLRTASKVPLKSWQTNQGRNRKRPNFSIALSDDKDMTESDVIFRQGELVCGVLDKAQYGPSSFGLVHACFELYGGETSAQLLSSFARLFTFFLQLQGFSLGVEDILVAHGADFQRRRIMATVDQCGPEAVAQALQLDANSTSPEMLRNHFERAHRAADQSDMKVIDGTVKGMVDKLNNDITRACMPGGLVKEFPQNQLQTMVMSGAKGATVNCIQMSCLLGQIELEGARPPLMLSGRTHPSFRPYESSPRSGGFVVQRFATGLRPQEYFFHCMAGREGLIDTAVKTSRSGYLQRCLIKHLEGVVVNYDLTVRNSDGGIIQFLYGEDGLDIGKTPFFSEKQMPFLISNVNHSTRSEIKRLSKTIDVKTAAVHDRSVKAWKEETVRLSAKARKKQKLLQKAPDENIALLQLPRISRMSDTGRQNDTVEPTLSACRPDIHFGSISERLHSIMEKYMKNPPISGKMCQTQSGFKSPEALVQNVVNLKYMKSLCQPGEAVGALVGQSIGEPSTQMTLNTFHFAGRGEMNVTLGIPRLREILMTGSKTIKTPTMEVPVKKGMENEAELLRIRLTRLMFSEMVDYMEMNKYNEAQENDNMETILELYIKFISPEEIVSKTCITSRKVLMYFEKVVVRQLVKRIRQKGASVKKQTKKGHGNEMDEAVEARGQASGEGGEDGGEEAAHNEGDDEAESLYSDDEAADPEGGKAQRAADAEYRGDEDDEIVREWEDGEEARMEDEDGPDEHDKENSLRSDSDGDADISADLLASLIPPTPHEGKKSKKRMNAIRTEGVMGVDSWVKNYRYDPEENNWCRLTLAIPMSSAAADPQSLIESELKKCVVHQVANIRKAFLAKEKNGVVMLRTEGVNFDYMMQFDEIVDLNRLMSNDIQAVAERFGIEAAAKTIIRECNSVFGAYGIDVNYRHLSLVADYMSRDGVVKAFNRLAIASNASPFQKMSFETSMNFYRDAVVNGARDTLQSPSAQLVIGERVRVGTGLFSLRAPVRLDN